MNSMGISIEAKFDQGASFVRVGRRGHDLAHNRAIPKEERSHSGIRVTPDLESNISVQSSQSELRTASSTSFYSHGRSNDDNYAQLS